MANNSFGSVGQVWVDVGADLSKLSQQMAQAVPEASAAGGKSAKAFSDSFAANYKQSGDLSAMMRTIGQQAGSSLVSGSKEGFDQFRARFKAAADEAAASAAGMDSSISGHAANIAGLLKSVSGNALALGTALSVGVTAPLVALASGAISAFADLDSLNRGLVTIAGGARQAAEQFRDMREVAKLPGLGLEEAIQGSIRLQAFGFSAGQAKDALLGFGNAIASVGGGKAELDRVIIQLGQMAGAGKILVQDLRPIIQTVPQVGAIIKQQLGPEALGEPEKALAKLGISSKTYITDMLVPALLKLPQVTGGIKNDLENFSDSVKISLAKLGEGMAPLVHFAVETFVPAMNAIIGVFSAMPAPMQGVVVVIGGLVAAAGPALLAFGGMARGLSEIIDFLAKVAPAAVAATTATEANTAAVLANASAQKAAAVEGAAFNEITAASGGLLGVAGVALLSFGAAIVATNAQLGDLDKKYQDFAATLKENRIDTLLAAGSTVADLEKLGYTLADIKAHLAGVATGVGTVKEEFKAATSSAYDFSKGLITLGLGGVSKETTELITKQGELRVKFDEAKKSVEELTRMQREGRDVTVALDLATKNLKTAHDALNPTIKGEIKSMAELAEKQGELTAKMNQAEAVVIRLNALQASGKDVTVALSLAHEQLKKAQEATGISFTELEKKTPNVIQVFGQMLGVTKDLTTGMDLLFSTALHGNQNIGDLSITMENGIRVIRGMREENEAAAKATQGLVTVMENGVLVSRSFAAAIAQVGTDAHGTVYGGMQDLEAQARKLGESYGQTAAYGHDLSFANVDLATATLQAGAAFEQAAQWGHDLSFAENAIGASADGAGLKVENLTKKLADLNKIGYETIADMDKRAAAAGASRNADSMFKFDDSAVFGARSGGKSTGASFGTTTDAATGQVGDILLQPGMVIAPGANAAGLTQQQIDQAKMIKAMAADVAAAAKIFQDAGWGLGWLQTLQRQSAETGKSVASLAQALIAQTKANELAAKEADAAELAAKRTIPTVEGLGHALDALIEAGQGNSEQAKELFLQLEQLDTAYTDTKVAATGAGGGVRLARAALTDLSLTATQAAASISQAAATTRIAAHGLTSIDPVQQQQTQAEIAANLAAAGKTTSQNLAASLASIGAPSVPTPLPLTSINGGMPTTSTLYPVAPKAAQAAQAAQDPAGTGYFVNGAIQTYSAPSYSAPAATAPSTVGLGTVGPNYFYFPGLTPEQAGQKVTEILKQQAGF